MRKFLPWAIGLVVGTALGVSGTYAIHRSMIGESHACAAWSHYIDHWPTDENGDIRADTGANRYTDATLDYWDKLLTIRNKACQ